MIVNDDMGYSKEIKRWGDGCVSSMSDSSGFVSYKICASERESLFILTAHLEGINHQTYHMISLFSLFVNLLIIHTFFVLMINFSIKLVISYCIAVTFYCYPTPIKFYNRICNNRKVVVV